MQEALLPFYAKTSKEKCWKLVPTESHAYLTTIILLRNWGKAGARIVPGFSLILFS